MGVTDPPTAVVVEEKGEGRTKAGTTEISPPTTVKLVFIHTYTLHN